MFKSARNWRRALAAQAGREEFRPSLTPACTQIITIGIQAAQRNKSSGPKAAAGFGGVRKKQPQQRSTAMADVQLKRVMRPKAARHSILIIARDPASNIKANRGQTILIKAVMQEGKAVRRARTLTIPLPLSHTLWAGKKETSISGNLNLRSGEYGSSAAWTDRDAGRQYSWSFQAISLGNTSSAVPCRRLQARATRATRTHRAETSPSSAIVGSLPWGRRVSEGD